jgi:hypothetical protein
MTDLLNKVNNGGGVDSSSKKTENLLSQYKKISQANDQKLRAARNIKELV